MTEQEKKTAIEFRDNGLLWWVNRSLHIFGYAFVLHFEDPIVSKDNLIEEEGALIYISIKRVKYRGFGPLFEELGFKKLANYIAKNSQELYDEAEYDT